MAIGDVFGINATGRLTVNNSGTIGRADAVNNIFDAAGINALAPGLMVTNNAGGVIQGSMDIQGAGTGTIVKFGADQRHRRRRRRHQLQRQQHQHGDGDQQCHRPSPATNSAINSNSATVSNFGTISAPTFGGTGILANNLNLTNYASGVITGDGGAISKANADPDITNLAKSPAASTSAPAAPSRAMSST